MPTKTIALPLAHNTGRNKINQPKPDKMEIASLSRDNLTINKTTSRLLRHNRTCKIKAIRMNQIGQSPLKRSGLVRLALSKKSVVRRTRVTTVRLATTSQQSLNLRWLQIVALQSNIQLIAMVVYKKVSALSSKRSRLKDRVVIKRTKARFKRPNTT